jgi:hypothetical protein
VRHAYVITALLLTLGGSAAVADAPATGPTRAYGYDPRPDLVAFDPQYRQRKRAADDEYDRLKEDLIAQQRRGRKTSCARQVLNEAKWYTHSTARFADAHRRLNDLRQILAAPRDPHDGGQLAADGSFGCCTEQWFLRLDDAVDELAVLGMTWSEPEHPLTLLERINGPEKLRAYLDSVRISDTARTGVDSRTELNHATSALARFILWQGTAREIPTKYDLHPGLKGAFLAYLDEWQDPGTGFWGTWYRTADGRLVKTSDLSITFHLVSYRGGRVNQWPRIVETTLAMRGGEYPYGWLEDGRRSNHHNYDVALLLRLGWTHATDAQRAEIRREVDRMVAWCLTETIEPDGTFKVLDDNTLGGAFFFGVAFLNEVGYFTPANRFWTDRAFPEAEALRTRVLGRLNELKLDGPEARWARMILWASGFASTRPG